MNWIKRRKSKPHYASNVQFVYRSAQRIVLAIRKTNTQFRLKDHKRRSKSIASCKPAIYEPRKGEPDMLPFVGIFITYLLLYIHRLYISSYRHGQTYHLA